MNLTLVSRKKKLFLILISVMMLAAASLSCSVFTGQRTPARKSARTPVPKIQIPTPKADIEMMPTVPAPAVEATLPALSPDQKITVEITEAQVNALVKKELQNQAEESLSDVQVTLQGGLVTITGKFAQSGFSLPLKVELRLYALEGKPRFDIVSATLGPMPLPEELTTQLSEQLDQAMTTQLAPDLENVYIESIVVDNGKIIITGHAR